MYLQYVCIEIISTIKLFRLPDNSARQLILTIGMGSLIQDCCKFQRTQSELPRQQFRSKPQLSTQPAEKQGKKPTTNNRLQIRSTAENNHKFLGPKPPSARPLMEPAQSLQAFQKNPTTHQTKTSSSQTVERQPKNLSQLQPVQLKQQREKRESFLRSERLNNAVSQSSELQAMMQVADQAQNLLLYQQSKRIYLRCLATIEPLAGRQNQQYSQEVAAYIYSQLTDLSMAANDPAEADEFMAKAARAYHLAPQYTTFQQQITLLNNYSLFKRSCGQLQEAKKCLQDAIRLMQKYYAIEDERRFLALVNLECLHYQDNEFQEARNIVELIKKQCRSKEVIRLAEQNQTHYQAGQR